ncbi:MAG TPA: hypothetical protein VEX86_28685 [Longimicrobium sp.]|nr:hypothetical protein [Longimicrobium sp.]
MQSLRPRPSRSVEIVMPTDVTDTLNELAEARDMPFEALVRLYVGQGMRQDVSKRWGERGGNVDPRLEDPA